MSKLEDTLEQVVSLLKSLVTPKVEITKSVNQEERRALFVAMEPEVEDAHGDITSAVEVEKACNNFNKHRPKANLFHLMDTEAIEIQQSFITPSDIVLESGRIIQKGSWMMWMHCPEGNAESDVVWEMIKTGEITGVSISGRGIATEIE